MVRGRVPQLHSAAKIHPYNSINPSEETKIDSTEKSSLRGAKAQRRKITWEKFLLIREIRG